MEGCAVTQATLDLFERAYASDKNVGIVLQAYLKRTPADVAGADRTWRARAPVQGRVQRAAGDRDQRDARDPRAVLRRLRKELLERGNYPAIATHDRELIDEIRAYVRERGIPRDGFEFQMLYGVPAAAAARARRRRLSHAHLRSIRNALGRLFLSPRDGAPRERALRAFVDVVEDRLKRDARGRAARLCAPACASTSA